MKAKYINPYTDFGFKKLFGEEANKDLLVDFLNQLLPPKHKIVELSFKNPEKHGHIEAERKAIFDIYCQNINGEQFIVEMQKSKLQFFKDRAVYYTTFPIREQAEKGDWDFRLKPVYCVAILDFVFDDGREQTDYLSNVELKDQYCRTFYDKLQYIFIEMPRFQKKEHELENHFDKWLYFLKHLEDFDTIPDILNEEVFIKGFETAKIANFDGHQLWEYEESLKVYRDLKGAFDTSRKEGREKGREEGRKEGRKEGIEIGEKGGIKKGVIQTAKEMKKIGLDTDTIARATGLSIEEIEKL